MSPPMPDHRKDISDRANITIRAVDGRQRRIVRGIVYPGVRVRQHDHTIA